MKKQLIVVGIIVLLVCVGLSGCTSNPSNTEKSKFVGTWKEYDGFAPMYTFSSDGTCSYYETLNGTYDIEDGKLVITYGAGGVASTYSYSFSNNDNTLTLTMVDGTGPQVLTKQ